ncbi:hypothetical protein CC80DRAFT_95617 [Byssothecium circinans]|uniref:Pheromone-regulated membrane protein n=1 Tax=Byssothecium circinans TaxID=147558 RepID=A0A6A5UFW8_9PLEO|nr:hypothetical protein CC80DRAFT_95617 [Byssothecium circinans]
MGCCGDREKGITVTESQKWDYLTLSDFKSTSCLTPLSYVWLWILVVISGAVYAADAFTAVNLLAFNKWSGEVKPKVPFNVAKWIFAICIIVSYVFLIYRWIRAVRVIRSGSVAECYLEPLAAIWQSMRLTKSGQGWRRFLVFAELTKSRKGVDYIAIFVYFQFKSALIIILAQGPRVALNAMTLWAVMQAQLIPVGKHSSKDHPAFIQFFVNIETMTQTGNRRETIIYFTMLFSLVIWVIGALSLLLSLLFYICYLWRHVSKKSDGSLTQYCRRKIETRLERIVNKKIKKALEKQDMKRRKEEAEATGKGDAGPRMPTLPKLGGDDDASSVYSMSTVTTLPPPPYSSNAPTRTNTMNTMGTARSAAMKPSLPSLNERPFPSRSDTQGTAFSNASFGSNAPLLGQAGDMGMASPLPPMPPLDRNADYFNGPPARGPTPNGMAGRPYYPTSQGRASPAPSRGMPPLDTQFNGRNSPAPTQVNPPFANRRPGESPLAGPTFSPYNNRGPARGPSYEMSPVDMTPNDYAPSPSNYSASNSPEDYRPPQLPNVLRSGSPAQQPASQQAPRAGTAPPSNPRAGVPATLQAATQRREASQPLPYRGPGMPQQRSATAPLRQPGYGPAPTDRSGTPPRQGYSGYNGY